MATAARQLKPLEAADWLRSRILTPVKAIDNLEGVNSLGQMLKLFKHYFPAELEQHKSVSLFSEDGRRKVLEAFYKLVDKTLFPLNDWSMDFYEMDEGHLSMLIPTATLNDDWWEYDIADLCALPKAVMIGAGALDEKRGQYEQFNLMNYARLEQLVKDLGEPLCWLPDAVKYVAHDTGYDWLDADNEMIGYAEDYWDIPTVDGIAQTWLEIKPILDRYRALHAWMHKGSDAQKAKRFTQVRKLVADAVQSKERVQVRVGAGRPLIDVLGDEGILDGEE